MAAPGYDYDFMQDLKKYARNKRMFTTKQMKKTFKREWGTTARYLKRLTEEGYVDRELRGQEYIYSWTKKYILEKIRVFK